MSIALTTLALGAAKFLSEGTAKHFLGKELDRLFSEDEFQKELYNVICDTLKEYEINFPVQGKAGKFPFYLSQPIINELLKIRLFKEDGDTDKILTELKQNSNIIPPNEIQIRELLNLFYSKIQGNEKLKQLNIESNYKAEIFNISFEVHQLASSLNATISGIVTELSAEWRRQLEVYKENLEQFKPKTALSLLNKLEIAMRESDTPVSDKIYSKLYYLKALCYSMLLDTNNAHKEYLNSYTKDTDNPVYKGKAALVYYSSNRQQEAQKLAHEIIQIDFDNPVANFILSVSENEIVFYDNIKQKPEYIRKNKTFKYLILLYLNSQKERFISLQDFLIDEFIVIPTGKVNFDNFYSCAHNVEYAIFVYLANVPFINFNERTKSNQLLELIHNECKNIVEAISESEVKDLYKGIFFWYYMTDYIVNDNVNSLMLSKSYLIKEDINSAIMLANCLQNVSKENDAIEVLSSLTKTYPDIPFLKAFCYAKLEDYANYYANINTFIYSLDKIARINFERLLPTLCTLLNENKSETFINIDVILAKPFELDIHKQIIENILKYLKDKDDANFEELYRLASDTEISDSTKSIIAFILLKTNNPDMSVGLYRQFIDKSTYNQNLFFYIQALYKTKNDNKELLLLLKEWRTYVNLTDDFLLNIEFNLRRELNDGKECLEIIKLIYSKNPYQETVFSNYFMCLHEMGEKDKINELKEHLSSVKFSDLNNVRNIVIVLFQNDLVQEALEFLYPFAKNKENSNMRMLFINLCLQKPEQTDLKKYETVIDDCYVQIKYEETDEIKSVYINKVSINEMQKSLLGHKIGDRVHIKIPTCDMFKSVIIHDIMNNYQALHYEIYHEMDNPIDSNLPMTSFHLPENCDIEGLNDFFIKTFAVGESKRRLFIEENLTKYKTGKQSFFLIAAIVFQSDFMRTYSVLSSSQYGILLNPNITAMAHIDLSNKEFVLDFSAIFCFYELFKSKGLSFKHKFIISKSISDFIENKIAETKANPESKMALDISIKGVTPIFFPENHKEQLILFYEDIKQWINNNCAVEIIEERLDVLRKAKQEDYGASIFSMKYLADYMYILNKPNRILISDDAIFHGQYGQQNRLISSQFYLKDFFNVDEINRELLRRNYIGVPIEKNFLKIEFINKIAGRENVYSQCLDSLSYLLPQNKSHIIDVISLFLKDIYTTPIFTLDLNLEIINMFVCILNTSVNFKRQFCHNSIVL